MFNSMRLVVLNHRYNEFRKSNSGKGTSASFYTKVETNFIETLSLQNEKKTEPSREINVV